MNPRVSIIIPCKDIDALTSESIDKCRQLDYDNFEIIVLPDDHSKGAGDIKIIATGAVSPGGKRNMGAKNSAGEFLAFIDSDAYPRRDWLRNALRYFSDPQVAAVGGPGVTPDEDPILQKAGGCILSSFMVGGIANRYGSAKSRESDDILPWRDRLSRMTAPFDDKEISITIEHLYNTYRKQDHYISRYCAMMGMNDPLCLFKMNYDRLKIITNLKVI